MINLVTALHCEAQPLIKNWRLKKIKNTSVYPVYRADNINLVISGVGRLFSAAACAYLQALNESENDYSMSPAWLNVGVAGHGSLERGTGLMAEKISDASSGSNYYPTFVFDIPVPSSPIITVDQPQTRFTQSSLYDMEAAGFFSSASRFSTAELIHSFKVVSDNEIQGIGDLNKELVSALINEQITNLQQVVEALLEVQSVYGNSERVYDQFTVLSRQYHFTVSQAAQLKRLLQRWHALQLGDMEPGQKKTAKELLTYMQTRLLDRGSSY